MFADPGQICIEQTQDEQVSFSTPARRLRSGFSAGKRWRYPMITQAIAVATAIALGFSGADEASPRRRPYLAPAPQDRSQHDTAIADWIYGRPREQSGFTIYSGGPAAGDRSNHDTAIGEWVYGRP